MRHWFTPCLLLTLSCRQCSEKESDPFGGTYAQALLPEDPELARLSSRVKVNYPESWVSLTFDETGAFLLYKGDIDIEVGVFVDENLDSNGEEPYPVTDLVVDLDAKTVEGWLEIPKYPDLKFSGVFSEDLEVLTVTVSLLGEITLLKVPTEAVAEATEASPITTIGEAYRSTAETGLVDAIDSGDSGHSGDTGWGVITL